MVMEAPPGQMSCVTAWTEARAWALSEQRKEESVKQIPIKGRYPWGNA